jgi:putative colanic acid biosynthesis acetyltransferase WcaF
MGHRSCLASRVNCYNVARVTIGANARISQGAHLCTASHNHHVFSFPLVVGAISIGDDAWIASEAFVGPGVEIGVGAVVGARSVVFHDVGPWSIVVGNPSKIVGSRNVIRED